MNLLVLGATGRVGSHIVKHALHDGHHVTVLVRTPEKIQNFNKNLTILKGNVLNKEDITHAIDGNDVVISALNTDGTTTLSVSMPLIIEAMYNAGIQRIITVGTAGILQSEISSPFLRYQSSESRRKSTRAAEEHHQVFHLLKNSTLNWTIVCPTFLENRENIGEYRVERDILPEGGIKISVLDTAEFTYNQIKDCNFIRSRVGIAY
ncbi:putative NADH-flavin reductase [Paenibacillus rhizosphaerae]|uniref:Putative NADH-flavin reductase n=1 Tax=Paenibacillus rhizosphaerae TaxID=297318 RepID=A0A839TFI2_9BACL|nr:SDR family oxidoreductase [Paenibacillus rhizosphaerae]MBB3125461.1 putative NADH-flavin reductase [Paenibacillus rhizosphaerae]